MKNYIHYDVIIGSIVTLLAFVFYPLTKKFPGTAYLFPQFVLIVLGLLGIYTLVSGIISTKKARKEISEGKTVDDPFQWVHNKLPMAGYLGIVLYVLAIEPLGFFTATSIFLILYMLFLRVRKPLTLVLVTLGVDVFVYVLFVMQLNLSLPEGLFI